MEVLNLKRPMLATSETLTEATLPLLSYPVYVSAKLDGVRATRQQKHLWTRTLLEFPNTALVRQIIDATPEGLDFEITVGDPVAEDAMYYSNGVMGSMVHEDQSWQVHAFDLLDMPGAYELRLDVLRQLHCWQPGKVNLIDQRLCFTPEEVLAANAEYELLGYEGSIVRSLRAPYKHNRATFREQYLMKLKQFYDADGLILEVLEGESNTNEAKKDARGLTKRSTAKAGKVKNGTCGGFRCTCPEHPEWGEFKVGPGVLTAEQAKDFWERRKEIEGGYLTFKYQKKGIIKKPRFPGYKALRPRFDVLAAA